MQDKKEIGMVQRVLLTLAGSVWCLLYSPLAEWAPPGWKQIGLLLIVIGLGGLALTVPITRGMALFALPLSLSFVVGAQLQVYATLQMSPAQALRNLACWLSLWLLCARVLSSLLAWLEASDKRWQEAERPCAFSTPRLFVGSFSLFFLLGLVWPLAYYPICTNYDGGAHVYQALDGNYQTHHSLLYTLFYKVIFRINSIFHLSSDKAFLAIGLCQLVMMSLTIAYALAVMNHHGARRSFLLIALAFFCLFPPFAFFCFSTTKDTFFACFVVLFALELYRLVTEQLQKKRLVFLLVRMAVFAIGMSQLRHNGLFGFIAIGAVLLVWQLRQKAAPSARPAKRRKTAAMALFVLGVLVLNTAFSQAMVAATHAEKSITIRRDILSVPLQQLVRVLVNSENPQEVAEIASYFTTDNDGQSVYVGDLYSPRLADPARDLFINTDENVKGMLELWLRELGKHPRLYVEGYLELMRGAWYIDDISHANIKPQRVEAGYVEVEQRSTFPVDYRCYWPAAKEFFNKLLVQNVYLQHPLIKWIFSLGLQTWIMLLGLVYALRCSHRKQAAGLLFLFELFTLLPYLIHPCIISRYWLPFFLLNPICLLALSARPGRVVPCPAKREKTRK